MMKPETRSKSMALIREYFDHVPLKVSFKEEIKSYQFWKSVRTEFLATLLFVTIGCGICIVSNYDTIHSDCGQVEREVGREVERKFAENFSHFDSGEGPSGVQLTGKQALGRQQTSNQSLVHDGQIGLQTEQENVGQENVGQGNVGQENAGASLQNVDMGPHSGSRGKRQVAVQHLVDSSGTNEPKGFTPSSSSGFSSSIPDSSASSHVSTPSSSTDSTFRVHLDNKNQHLGSSLSEGGEEDILHVPTSQPTSPLLYLHEQAWIESSFSPSAIKSNLLKQTNHGGTSSPNYNNRGKSGSIMIDSNQHGPNSGRTRGKSSEGSGKSSEGPGQRECNKPDEMYHLKNGLGFALLTTLLMIITSNQIHGYTNCHLNPCLTLASFITRDTSLLKLILFVIVQSIASILGSVVLFGLTSYKRDAGTSQEPIHHHDVHGRYLGSTQLTVEDNTFNSIHPSFHTENIPVPNLFGFEFIATFLIVLTYFSVTEKLHDSSRSRLGDGSSRNGPIHRTIIIPFEGKDFRCHCRQGRDVNETQPEEERKKNQTREERTGGEDNDLCTNICTRCCRSCCHLLEGGQKLCGRSEEEGEIDVARFGKRRNEMDRKEGNAIIIKEWTQASPSSSSSSSTGFFVVGISLLTCHLFVAKFTGAAFNPIRILGPAVLTNIWTNHWVYWIGPMMGSIFAAITFEYIKSSKPPSLRERSHGNEDEDQDNENEWDGDRIHEGKDYVQGRETVIQVTRIDDEGGKRESDYVIRSGRNQMTTMVSSSGSRPENSGENGISSNGTVGRVLPSSASFSSRGGKKGSRKDRGKEGDGMEMKHSPSGGLTTSSSILLDALTPNAESAATNFTTIDIDDDREQIVKY